MQVFAPFVLKRKNLFVRIISVALCVVLMGVLLSQTVFAKNTYVITDGDRVRVYTTYATDPADVLIQAGVELGDGDIYITEPGNGVSEITVQRSQLITVDNCGEVLQEVSYGETVEALLDRMGIAAYGKYSVSVPMDSMTYDGLEIYIDSVVEVKETYTVDMPYETVFCYDPTLAEGQEEVRVAGVIGQLSRTANVVYVNAEEASRTVLTETVLQQPVNEIVAIGTGTGGSKDAPAIGDGFIVTASGEVLTYYRSEQFKTTAYTKTDAGCDDITATGTYARVGAVAVDPKVIPYGTRMFIVSNDGAYVYGIATAEDCGGGVKGNHIDLYFDTTAECFQYGVRSCTVYFLG